MHIEIWVRGRQYVGHGLDRTMTRDAALAEAKAMGRDCPISTICFLPGGSDCLLIIGGDAPVWQSDRAPFDGTWRE